MSKPITIFDTHQCYLVGIKGVAMTSLAQCLVDLGKQVSGCDTAEDFVTKKILARHNFKIELGFDNPIPEHADCVIYTAAHGGPTNPVVVAAHNQGLLVLSQAEAIAQLANAKQGIAICGVGGKSTVSAMITWILEKTGFKPSYSVGVGSIPGLDYTGKWSPDSKYFVVEADEYVTDPAASNKGEALTPRFSYLKPYITVCTNLAFDHPDVYQDFEHTKKVFATFFSQNDQEGFFCL